MIRIRKARVDDASRIAELWYEMAALHSQLGEMWRLKRGSKRGFEEHIAKVIAEKEAGVFVAHDGEAVVGFIQVLILKRPRPFAEGSHGLISDIAVTTRYRRRGAGERLCRRALRWVRERGAKTVTANVATANPLANAFWSAMGFRPYVAAVRKKL